MLDLIQQPNQNELLSIRIVSSKGELFNGKAYSLSSKNSIGKFDILPRHIDFITFVQNSPIIIINSAREKLTFNFPFSILHASKNSINIYTDLFLKLS